MFNKINIRTQTKLSKEEIYNHIKHIENLLNKYILTTKFKHIPDIHFIKLKKYKKWELFGYYIEINSIDKIYISRDIAINFIEESIIHEYCHHLYKWLYLTLPDNFVEMNKLMKEICLFIKSCEYMKDNEDEYLNMREEIIVRTMSEIILNERLYLTDNEYNEIKDRGIKLLKLMNDNILNKIKGDDLKCL